MDQDLRFKNWSSHDGKRCRYVVEVGVIGRPTRRFCGDAIRRTRHQVTTTVKYWLSQLSTYGDDLTIVTSRNNY